MSQAAGGGSTPPSAQTPDVVRPHCLELAVRLCAVLVAFGVLAVLLTIVLRDELVRSWAQGRPDERQLLRTGGLAAVRAGAVHPPAFVPVTTVLFVVVAGLIWVLAAFLRNGYGWARVGLSALLVLVGVSCAASLRTGPPVLFVLLCLVSFAIELAIVVQLWRPGTGAFLRGSPRD